MARKKKTAAPEPDLEIRADPELIAEELEPVKPERSHTELMRLRGLGLLPPGEDFIPTSLFVSNNVLTSGMGGDLEAAIDASGIASFNIPGKAFTNIEELIVDIVPVQEGSGDPSPDNVRPITGWSEAKVTRTGKNLLNFSGYSYISNYNIIWGGGPSGADGSLMLNAGTYTFSVSETQQALYVIDKDNNPIAPSKYNTKSTTFTLTERSAVKIQTYKSGVTSTDILGYKYQLELDSSASSYEPYNGQIYIIELDGTRYGCKLDVRRGKLRVDMAMGDMGTLNWSYYSDATTSFFSAQGPSGIKPVPSNTDRANMICSQYSVRALWDDGFSTSDNVIAQASPSNLRVRDSAYTDAAAFKTAMNGVQLVYELATPIEVDLSPVNITALLGDNNIWADCGPVTKLEYSYDLLINQN